MAWLSLLSLLSLLSFELATARPVLLKAGRRYVLELSGERQALTVFLRASRGDGQHPVADADEPDAHDRREPDGRALTSSTRYRRRLIVKHGGSVYIALMVTDLSGASDAKFALTPGERLSGRKLVAAVKQIADQSGDILGSKTKAYDWLQTHPIPAFDGKTAQQIIARGWARAILQYLDELRYGSRG